MNDYSARINRVIDYMEKNLDRDLSLDELASVAAFSKYHFHRIFRVRTGEGVGEFLQRHRLETAAARLLRNRSTPVTDIALSCGFASSASFANSFRRRFGLSPSRWRQEKSSYVPDSNLSEVLSKADEAACFRKFHTEYRDEIQIWRTRNEEIEKIVRVKMLPPLTLAYIRYTGAYKGDDKLFERLWGELMRWAGPRGLMEREETRFLALYHNYPDLTEDDKLRLSVCLSIPEEMETGDGMGRMDFEGGKYACYECVVGPEDYQRAWDWIYREWLPCSGYQPSDSLPLEHYPRDQRDVPEGKQRVEICVPVAPL